MAWSLEHRYGGGEGTIIVVPPWPYAGSANMFAAQAAAHAAAGRKVLLLAGPIDREHCADQVGFWARVTQGLSFPGIGPARYASNPDTMSGPGSPSFERWQAAGQDDAIAISARYAATADLPPEVAAFVHRHRIALVHVNHCFEAQLGNRVADLVGHVQGRRPAVLLETHDIQAVAFLTARKRNHHSDTVDPFAGLRETELALCRTADVLIHCAPDDLAYFQARLPAMRHAVLPPSLDPRTERRLVSDRGGLFETSFDALYVGNNNSPNCDSVVWLLEEVVPHLAPEVRIGIVGAVGGLLRSRRPDLHARHGAMMLGEVERVDDYYRRSRAIIAPAISGTGTSIKLIEGLCAGKPMVVTSRALRGLPVGERDQAFLKVADEPGAFAAALTEMLATTGQSSALAAAFYDRTFSGEQYSRQLDAIVRRHATPAPAAGMVHSAPGGGTARATLRIELPAPCIPVIFREGWHGPETFGRWTAAARSELLLVFPAALGGPLRITVELARPADAAIALDVNDVPVGPPEVHDNAQSWTWQVERLVPDSILRLGFGYDAVTGPYGLSPADARALGLAVRTIAVEAEEAPSVPRPILASALMCKTFGADLPRFEILERSILHYDRSALPLVVCAPHADLPALRRIVAGGTTLVAEEEFVEPRCFEWLDGWRQQQVVKLAFHRLGICDRYMAIDADCYFIRPFDEADLFGGPAEMRVVAQTSEPDIPYGTLFENHDLALGRAVRPVYSDAAIEFQPGPLRIPDCFVRDRTYKSCPPELARSLIPFAFSADYPQRRLMCLPPPMLFCAEIVAALEAMVVTRDLSLVDLIHLSPWEAEWYGHFALKYFADRIRTVTPMFKNYSTDGQIAAARRAGVTDATLARNFLGVNLAARHQTDLRL